jgi:hypothetical protein
MIRFFSKGKEVADMCGTICPKIRKKMYKNIDFARNYEAEPAAEHLFKVKGLRAAYEVNIKKMECSCRAWQLTGIPCRHACACLRSEEADAAHEAEAADQATNAANEATCNIDPQPIQIGHADDEPDHIFLPPKCMWKEKAVPPKRKYW